MKLTELFHHETDLVEFPAGANIFSAGDSGDLMYVLMEGTADIIVGNMLVEHAEPGAILGEMALVESAPRTATVHAVTACKLIPIDQKRFHFLVQQTPNFAIHMMKIIADRLRKMDLRLLELQEK